MLDLSPETEELAHRLARAAKQSVDAAVQDALRAHAATIREIVPRDTSPEAVAARRQAIRRIVAEMAALPVVDPRPVQEIVDELNEI